MFIVYENTQGFDVNRPYRQPGAHLVEYPGSFDATQAAKRYSRNNEKRTIVIRTYTGNCFPPREYRRYGTNGLIEE